MSFAAANYTVSEGDDLALTIELDIQVNISETFYIKATLSNTSTSGITFQYM